MNKRDTIRVFKYDEEIAELEYQLALQLNIESAQGKTMFPVSKGIEYKLSRIRGARARFIKVCGHTVNKRIRYDMITAEKRAAIARAELEYKQELARYTLLISDSLTPKDAAGVENLNIQRRLCTKKKRAVAACTAALSRWLLVSPDSIAAPIPVRADEDYILTSRHMPKAELRSEQPEQLAAQPALALSTEQEIIARVARAHIAGASTVSTPHADMYKASFDLLDQQSMVKEDVK